MRPERKMEHYPRAAFDETGPSSKRLLLARRDAASQNFFGHHGEYPEWQPQQEQAVAILGRRPDAHERRCSPWRYSHTSKAGMPHGTSYHETWKCSCAF